MDPELLQIIDEARRGGATYDEVASRLKTAGHLNAKRILTEYTAVTDHLGRPRSEANPGDPADPLNR